VPDERSRKRSRPAGPSRPGSIDLADGLAEFAAAFPAWIERDGPEKGYPLSWAHYVYGMAHLRRASLREQLRAAEAVRAGNLVTDAWKEWLKDVRDALED
jgi:hypothetical protein